MKSIIPFNSSNYNEETLKNIKDVLDGGHTSGNGKYTKLCNQYLEKKIKTRCSLITHSCTASLEMSALLIKDDERDEVIMPSFTFVSTANAFVLMGMKPVFVDIRADNNNIDENLIESAITKKTKAIVPVHYAGVACDMDMIMSIAAKYNLVVIEDAAQAFNSYYKNRHLGSIGVLGALSFHETKNIISGEGGALLINDEDLISRAKIIRDKGTNRDQFLNGQADKYRWVDVGSSYLPSDLITAYLYSNLSASENIQARRLKIWQTYYNAFEDFQNKGVIKLPFINDFATNNGHMFYIKFYKAELRNKFINYMKENNIITPFHYVPLHSSPAGLKFCRYVGDMKNTNETSETLVRFPIFYDLTNLYLTQIIEISSKFFQNIHEGKI